MGKSATVFKDIGKACKDLLEKDYKVGKNVVEVKSKTSSGITFTPTATKSGDAVSGTLKANTPVPGLSWLDSETVFGTDGGVEVKLEAADVAVKGLTVTAECERKAGGKSALSAANLIAEYKSEPLSCKTSFDYFKQDLLASASTVYQAFTLGLDATYSTKKGALAKYAAACEFVQPEFNVTAKCDDKAGAKTLSCSYYHKVSADMQLGVSIAKALSKPDDPTIEFGTAYKLDKDTAVKAKVDSQGILSASFKQKFSALTTMTLAAQVDTVNLGDNKHKFGLQLNLTP